MYMCMCMCMYRWMIVLLVQLKQIWLNATLVQNNFRQIYRNNQVRLSLHNKFLMSNLCYDWPLIYKESFRSHQHPLARSETQSSETDQVNWTIRNIPRGNLKQNTKFAKISKCILEWCMENVCIPLSWVNISYETIEEATSVPHSLMVVIKSAMHCRYTERSKSPGPLLLTWFHLNRSMGK